MLNVCDFRAAEIYSRHGREYISVGLFKYLIISPANALRPSLTPSCMCHAKNMQRDAALLHRLTQVVRDDAVLTAYCTARYPAPRG